MQNNIRELIKEKLSELLNNITPLFAHDELAYITLQQKNERQIRDKIAFHLQRYLDEVRQGEYLARCEWPSFFDEKELDYTDSDLSGRTAVDLAILKMNPDRTDYEEVIALIEFKAHCFLNEEPWPKTEFAKDVTKMVCFTNLSRKGALTDKRIKNADLYFVMTISSHDKNMRKEYASAVVYKDILDIKPKSKSCKHPTLYGDTVAEKETYVNTLKDWWRKFNQTIRLKVKPGEEDKFNPQVQYIGESFGYKMYQTCMIWGPYKAQDVEISDKS